MTQILVTGATGTLGRDVVSAALAKGHQLRAMSRHDHHDERVRWHRADLATGEGVGAAVDGVEVVVHCATQPTGGKDVSSTEHLLTAAKQAGVGHVVYVSIVGVNRIPLPYYKTKLRVEQLVGESGIGHTVLRATQFHDLIATIFAAQRFSPVLFALRGVQFQPIDTRDVAARLVELAGAAPAGRAADIGGPEIRGHLELARAYLRWRNSRRPAFALPVPGNIGAGYRGGAHLAPQNRIGTTRFEDYLRRSW